MDWSVLLGIVAALFGGLNLFQLFSFRAYKKKFHAEAEKDEAEASESKQSALERRLGAMEALYDEQGKVIDSLRKDILRLSSETDRQGPCSTPLCANSRTDGCGWTFRGGRGNPAR